MSKYNICNIDWVSSNSCQNITHIMATEISTNLCQNITCNIDWS